MPLVRVSGNQLVGSDDKPVHLGMLRYEIKKTIKSMPELGITDDGGITCHFLGNMLEGDSDGTIIVEVVGLFDKPERTPQVRQALADALVQVVKARVREARLIQCFVSSFNPEQGFAEYRKK